MRLEVMAMWVGGSLQDPVLWRPRSFEKVAWSEVKMLCRGKLVDRKGR